MFSPASHADIPAIRVAHAQDTEAGTGVTVFIVPQGATCSVDVRGGAPATRETDLLRPENTVEKVHAVVLSGGSAYGLEASCGVMETLAERGYGFELVGCHVPIVCAASLFDLPVGNVSWPDKPMGRKAAERALNHSADPLAQGNAGAGCGATVGKMGLPSMAMKSGFGWCGARMGNLVVVANVAVNAVGNVVDANGTWIAGAQVNGVVIDPMEAIAYATASQDGEDTHRQSGAPTNTTIGVVMTNANLNKAGCLKVSQIAHDGYARAIRPVHTTNDGDAIFTMATGGVEAAVDLVGILAADTMERAIRNAVLSAKSAYGLVAAR